MAWLERSKFLRPHLCENANLGEEENTMGQKLTCLKCGTLNPDHRLECELCYSSLKLVRERNARGSAGKLLFVACAFSFVTFILPGIMMTHLIAKRAEIPHLIAGLCYILAWAFFAWIGHIYKPKEEYGPGDSTKVGSVTVYDDASRAGNISQTADQVHMILGFALFPINITVGAWRAFFETTKYMD